MPRPRPAHQIITPNVAVPTISVQTSFNGIPGEPTICIQWTGRADSGEMPDNLQFYFVGRIAPDAPHWQGHPENFRVAFMGFTKEWPKVEARQQMMKKLGEESIVCWVLSSKYPFQHLESGWIPTSFVFPLVFLADPNCGVIAPVTYYDQKVVDEENEKAQNENMSLADKLAQNMDMELPAEAMPWPQDTFKCDYCEKFQHSYDRNPAVPKGGTVHDLTYVCPYCGRRWWQYNRHMCLWKNVTNPEEWNGIRRQSILIEGGYEWIFEQ